LTVLASLPSVFAAWSWLPDPGWCRLIYITSLIFAGDDCGVLGKGRRLARLGVTTDNRAADATSFVGSTEERLSANVAGIVTPHHRS